MTGLTLTQRGFQTLCEELEPGPFFRRYVSGAPREREGAGHLSSGSGFASNSLYDLRCIPCLVCASVSRLAGKLMWTSLAYLLQWLSKYNPNVAVRVVLGNGPGYLMAANAGG